VPGTGPGSHNHSEVRIVNCIGSLLQRHLSELRAFVRLNAGPLALARESSSDIVQSVCRELVEEGSRFEFRGHTEFRSWLYTVARRKIRDRRRNNSRLRRTPEREQCLTGDSAIDRDILWKAHRSNNTPSFDLANREEVERIESCFAQLDAGERRLITLVRIEGRSLDCAGRELEISSDAARMRLNRALARLSSLLVSGRSIGT
jgi:RNA polymerase sigma-70 factor, ECF subfamily